MKQKVMFSIVFLSLIFLLACQQAGQAPWKLPTAPSPPTSASPSSPTVPTAQAPSAPTAQAAPTGPASPTGPAPYRPTAPTSPAVPAGVPAPIVQAPGAIPSPSALQSCGQFPCNPRTPCPTGLSCVQNVCKSSYCESSIANNCQDRLDNDNDNLMDCADPECGGCLTETGAVNTNRALQRSSCTNGRDDDGDKLIDVSDPDCKNVLEEGSYSTCFDTIDNDNDGATDCADTNCAFFCVENNGAGCYNGRDDDNNGLIDCMDPLCTTTIYCVLESGGQAIQQRAECWDRVDNDFDGLFDCADPNCQMAGACVEFNNCADNWDNDGNGLLDCRDPACVGDPRCACSDTDGGAVYTQQGSITIGNIFSTDGGTFPGMFSHRYDYCDESQPTKLYEFTCPTPPHANMFAAFPQQVDCTTQGYTKCLNGRCV